MTAKQVAKLMAEFLGQKDLLSTTILDGEQTPTDQQNQILSSYLTCINDVVQTLAISYFPLKQKQKLSSDNKCFAYSSFSNPLLQVVSVVDASTNTKIRFEPFVDHFVADANEVEVVYNYQPTYVSSFNSNLEVSTQGVSSRMIALGAVARYYLLEGLHDESVAWNNLFERAVLVAGRPKRSLHINKRSWF